MDHFHISKDMEDTSSESTLDNEVDTKGQLEPNGDSDNESNNETVEENEFSSGSEDEEENDFWRMLIKKVAAEIYRKREWDGNPGVLPFITDPEQIAEGQYLSHFSDLLRQKYYDIEQIHNAGCDDSVLNLIEDQVEKLRKQITDESNEIISQTMVWEKYRPLIRKKILKNLDVLEVLVGNWDLGLKWPLYES